MHFFHLTLFSTFSFVSHHMISEKLLLFIDECYKLSLFMCTVFMQDYLDVLKFSFLTFLFSFFKCLLPSP